MSRLTEPASNGKPLAHPIGHKATSTQQKVSLLAFRRLEDINILPILVPISSNCFLYHLDVQLCDSLKLVM